jgi:ribonuclease HI
VYFDARALKLYVDGSANPNPGRGGIGGIVEYPDDLGGHSETAFQVGYQSEPLITEWKSALLLKD